MSLVNDEPLRWDRAVRDWLTALVVNTASLIRMGVHVQVSRDKIERSRKSRKNVKYSHGSCYCFCLHTVGKKKIWNR